MNEFNENGEQGVITGMLHNFPGTMPGSDTDFSLKEDPEEQSTGSIPVECDSTAELKTCRPAVEGDVIELGGEFDYEGYQVVRREFFAHINEPSFTFNDYKVYVNAACLNRLPTVDYVQALVNQDSKILAIRPCREDERDAFSWCIPGSGKKKPKSITCRLFFAKVCTLMGWNPDYRYKLLGKVIHSNEEYLIAFDLSATEVYQRVLKDGNKSKTSRNPVFPEGWQNQFGLPFKEHRRSMQVNIFDGYAVYGIKDNTISAAAANPGDEPSNLPDTLIHYDMLGGSEI